MAMSIEQIRSIDAYWRAANYLTIGQIYLRDNPLLREPLQPAHIKPRLLGHWGTSPGLSDVVLASAGDVPTLETVAAICLFRRHAPALRVRMVNVVDLTTLFAPRLHPHGLPDEAFVDLFTERASVVSAFHGYQREMSRYHLCLEALRRVPDGEARDAALAAHCRAMLDRHPRYIREDLEDMPEVRDWRWSEP